MSDFDLKKAHDELHAALNEIDTTLDAASGDQKSAGKRKITNGLIEDSKESWEPIAESLVEQLRVADPAVQVGVYFGLIRALQNEFSKELGDVVEAMVEKAPVEETVELSEEDAKALSKSRSEIYSKLKTLIGLAESFGQADGMYAPKKRTGGRGKRGPRAISFFTWQVDGEDVENLKAVAEGYDQYEKTSDLTKAMREAEINLTKPEDRIEFTLPDGKILVGLNTAGEEVDDDDDDDDSAEDDSE